MSDIAPDAEAQTDQQNARVNKSPYRLYLGLPEWVRLAVKVCLSLWLVNFLIGIAPIEDRGTFGDTFGAANSLFSALALLGVAWSVSMQREELRLTRDDRNDTKKNLAQTQELLKIQEDNIKKQNEATTKQMFEATFFQMHTAFNQLVGSLSLKREDQRAQIPNTTQTMALKKFEGDGKEVFTGYLQEIGYRYAYAKYNESNKIIANPPEDDETLWRSIKRIHVQQGYQKFYNNHSGDVGRYFRSLYIILNYIEKSSIPQEEKYFYAKLIRANLSTNESTMIAITVISGYSTREFVYLLSKYGMAKNAFRRHHLLSMMWFDIPDGIYGQKYVRYRNKLGFHPTTEDYKRYVLFRSK